MVDVGRGGTSKLREARIDHFGTVSAVGVIYGPVRLVSDARDLAQTVLTPLPQRWRHTVGVARRAEQLGVTLESPGEVDLLVAAAWLHDIGYAPALLATGFHPLDGARHLLARDWPMPVAALVARHSDAADVAAVQGLSPALADFPATDGPVDDALTYADQTVSPDGDSVTFAERIAEMLLRHGRDSPNAAAHTRRQRVLRAAIGRVDERLGRLGLPSYA